MISGRRKTQSNTRMLLLTPQTDLGGLHPRPDHTRPPHGRPHSALRVPPKEGAVVGTRVLVVAGGWCASEAANPHSRQHSVRHLSAQLHLVLIVVQFGVAECSKDSDVVLRPGHTAPHITATEVGWPEAARGGAVPAKRHLREPSEQVAPSLRLLCPISTPPPPLIPPPLAAPLPLCPAASTHPPARSVQSGRQGGRTGRSSASVCTFPSRRTTFIPFATLPKIVCFPGKSRGRRSERPRGWQQGAAGSETGRETGAGLESRSGGGGGHRRRGAAGSSLRGRRRRRRRGGTAEGGATMRSCRVGVDGRGRDRRATAWARGR